MYNRHLDTFLAVAATGSFRKAAEQLYISSSAVIQQIDLLERDLSVPLFVRSNRGISLTAAGEYLAEEARGYIARGEQIRRHMITLSTQESGICVGTSIADKCRLLYDLWIMFTQEHKEYDVRMIVLDGSPEKLQSVQLIESIGDGALWQKGWDFLEICRVPIGCAVSKDHPCSGQRAVSLSDMREGGVVLIDRSVGDANNALRSMLKQEGIPFEAFPDWSATLIWECSLQKKMLLVPSCWEDVLFDVSILPCPLPITLPYGFFYRSPPTVPLREFLTFVRDVYAGKSSCEMIPVL